MQLNFHSYTTLQPKAKTSTAVFKLMMTEHEKGVNTSNLSLMHKSDTAIVQMVVFSQVSQRRLLLGRSAA